MRSFFGLTQTYIKNIYEQFFSMKYYAGWSIFELYSLPIGLRNFYVQMLVDLKEKQKEAADGTVTSDNIEDMISSNWMPPPPEGF